MKAMVFAAGLGTRLKPFTDYHPKALAEVCGRPMLGIVIEKLKKYGIDEIVVNVHHFAEQIVDYLRANDDFGIKVHISDERTFLLDTGGGILAARQWLYGNEPFVVHNADILTDVAIDDMIKAAKWNASFATLLVAERSTKRYLLFDKDNMRMQGWTNIDSGDVRPAGLVQTDDFRKLAFGGVHVISPSIFTHLDKYAAALEKPAGAKLPKFSIMDFYIATCATCPYYGYLPPRSYHWHDIGKPESLKAAENDFCGNKN